MKIIWLGHSSFRIEIEDQILLIDPWLAGNPSFAQEDRAKATQGATAIFLSHGHGDHASTAVEIAKEADLTIYCIHELAAWVEAQGAKAVGFGKGGTITLGSARVTMVNAVYSSSIDFGDGLPTYAGGEAGYIIRGEDHSIYFSGDTDVMADMGVIADRYQPDIGILSAGGHFTMDMEGAAYAARKFFNFATLIPCHFGTFPALEQSTDALVEALPGVSVVTPKVMEPITF